MASPIYQVAAGQMEHVQKMTYTGMSRYHLGSKQHDDMKNQKINIRLGKNQQKVLTLLFGGIAFGLAQSPKKQLQILRGVADEWKKIDTKHAQRVFDSLYKSKLVSTKKHADGSLTITLTDNGRKRALRYHLDSLAIPKPKKWDGKWHVVMYDVPEEKRSLRDELHAKLRTLGFVELQHSVFVHPYECTNQVEFLIEAYDARPYIRRLVAEEIDITGPIKRAFMRETAQSRRRVSAK